MHTSSDRPSDTDKHPHSSSRARVLLGSGDLGAAVLCAVLFLELVPSRHAWFQALAIAVSMALLIGGVGMLSRRRWGLYLGAVGAAILLLFGLGIIWGLLASAFYLHGIYGGFGKGAAVVLLVVTALVVEVVCLLPLVQLWWIRRALRKGSTGTRVKQAPVQMGSK